MILQIDTLGCQQKKGGTMEDKGKCMMHVLCIQYATYVFNQIPLVCVCVYECVCACVLLFTLDITYY